MAKSRMGEIAAPVRDAHDHAASVTSRQLRQLHRSGMDQGHRKIQQRADAWRQLDPHITLEEKLSLDEADVAVLRQSDAALVAAGLAAVWSGTAVFRSAVLARSGVAPAVGADAERNGELANVTPFISSTTTLGVVEDGTVAPFATERLVEKGVLGGLFLELKFETAADAEPANDAVRRGRLTELINLLKAFQDLTMV